MNKTLAFGIGIIVIAGIWYAYQSSRMSVLLVNGPAASASNDYHDNIYLIKTDAAHGSYLTDVRGMTLYTFDKDGAGVSICSKTCVKARPPYTSAATAQKQLPTGISIVTRADGLLQFAWNGKPLYYYASDAKAGDVTGDGTDGTWHIVKP